MAIVLIRKMGRPPSSNPYGITDPNGNPGCLRESVERLPIWPKWSKVRARSANDGSGIGGCALAGTGLACFLMDEDILISPEVGFAGFGGGYGTTMAQIHLWSLRNSRKLLK
jgi:hypothetical protein